MKSNRLLVALAAFLGFATTAHAVTTLTSGGLPTGEGNSVACYFRNVGPTPISMHAQGMINFTRNFTFPNLDTCSNDGVPLAPGRTCILLWNDIDDDTVFGCTTDVTAGNPKNLRAAAELRAPFGNGLRVTASSELR
jgi:hypothetical protein